MDESGCEHEDLILKEHTPPEEAGEPKTKGHNRRHEPVEDHEKISTWQRCCFVSVLPFTFHFGIVNLVTSALGAYLTSQITTIEKQFGLSSSESGVLSSMNDAGFLITVLFVTYLGRYSHIPRILAVCGVLYGVSALICIIPHFFTNHDSPSSFHGNSSRNISRSRPGTLCSADAVFETDLECSEREKSFSSTKTIAMGLISVGMFLQGMAKSPRQPLSQTYIDDNLPKTKSGFYIGIILCLAASGPAIAYSVGGSMSRIYVTLEDTNMSPRDPRFIGAWWFGFMIFGALSLVISIPLFCYPKYLKDGRQRTKSSLSKVTWEDSVKKKVVSVVKDAALAMKRLFSRPVYLLLVLSLGLRIFSGAGIIAFTPKYMQVHYGLSIYKSNIVIGFASLGTAAAAILLGGIMVRVVKMELKGMVRTLVITNICSSLIFFIGIFLACPQPEIQHFDIITRQLNGSSPSSLTESSVCFSGCNCEGTKFFPVCGSNGITYFSPCHAGCSTALKRGYQDCSCINSTGPNPEMKVDAVPGSCRDECPVYIWFIVIQCLTTFFNGISGVPGTLAVIRSVDEKDKSLALGINSFTSSLLGWFLGPIVMGAIIDTTCTLWNTSCSKESSCAVYDIADLRYKIHGVEAGLSVIYSLLVVIAYLLVDRCYKKERPGKEPVAPQTVNTKL